MSDSIQESILDILKKMKTDSLEQIQPSTDLFGAGVLDSFGMLQYIDMLEQKFSIRIPVEELIPQNLWSVEATQAMILRLSKEACLS